MIEVNLDDQAGVLSDPDFNRLKCFIIDKCLCTSDELAKLERVIIRDDGDEGYTGYWTGKYDRVGADIKSVTGSIVLNSFYLKTVEQMERTLAHEFGHHWTLSHLMDRQEMIGWFDERAPWIYYRIRGMDPDKYAKNYDLGWGNCDKEILAEDFKCKMSPYNGEHRMKNDIGNPTAEVADYIKSLGKPYWY